MHRYTTSMAVTFNISASYRHFAGETRDQTGQNSLLFRLLVSSSAHRVEIAPVRVPESAGDATRFGSFIVDSQGEISGPTADNLCVNYPPLVFRRSKRFVYSQIWSLCRVEPRW